jgi:hypothetical protein
VLEELVYRVSGSDPCLFMCNGGLEMIIALIHNDVDDSMCTGPESLGMAAITEIGNKLDIKQLGEAHVFLGLKIWRHDESIRLGQERYIAGMLTRFSMKICKPGQNAY